MIIKQSRKGLYKIILFMGLLRHFMQIVNLIMGKIKMPGMIPGIFRHKFSYALALAIASS